MTLYASHAPFGGNVVGLNLVGEGETNSDGRKAGIPENIYTLTATYDFQNGYAANVSIVDVDEVASWAADAKSVLVVPGYGMAVARAQHLVNSFAKMLRDRDVSVRFAIHPVAGRMPGHMNVLLAEANVPYDEVFELEDINSEFAQADIAFIIGANDVVNPAAKTDKSSPIYGMPVFDVDKAKQVFFIKRSMGGVGYAGVDNDVFYMDQTMMLLSDAKKMVEEIVKALD